MLVFLVQYGSAHLHVTRGGNVVDPFVALAVVGCVCAILTHALGRIAPRIRRAVRSRRARADRDRARASAERRARALMSELCPHGWSAQITLGDQLGDPAPLGSDGAPASVVLDWTELQDHSERPAVSRRVVAASIAEALDAMVADRRTDETLEHIERSAAHDGAAWPDA